MYCGVYSFRQSYDIGVLSETGSYNMTSLLIYLHAYTHSVDSDSRCVTLHFIMSWKKCYWITLFQIVIIHVRIQMGYRRSGPLLNNHQNWGFLSNSVPDPLKNRKATKPVFNVGPSLARQRNVISVAFRWRADGGPPIVVFVKVGPPLTKIPGSAHVIVGYTVKIAFYGSCSMSR